MPIATVLTLIILDIIAFLSSFRLDSIVSDHQQHGLISHFISVPELVPNAGEDAQTLGATPRIAHTVDQTSQGIRTADGG